MKKIFLSLLITILVLTGCSKTTVASEDALKFREEYESLNGEASGTNTIRSVKIAEDNPFIYKSAEEIVEMIDSEETFIVYFGFAKCPWCRSIIENLIEVSKELDIDKIYYVDVLDIRDTYELNEDNEKNLTKEGTEGYYALLERLNNVLADYTLTSPDGEVINMDEKRIYAPNIVAVINGKADSLTTGISSKQNDPYMELTKEINKESKNMIKEVLEKINDGVCTKEGC